MPINENEVKTNYAMYCLSEIDIICNFIRVVKCIHQLQFLCTGETLHPVGECRVDPVGSG
jgi:hypothetical protein